MTNFTLEKDRIYNREKDNLIEEIDALKIKNNILVEANAKLTKERDNELMKQVVAQRVQALDIMVIQMKAKETLLEKTIYEQNIIIKENNK
jgi:hypothetical protein